MKTILVLMVLLVSLQAQKVGADSISLTPSNVVRVYDGDTITINLPDLPPVFGAGLGVRIVGIDTPEMASKCASSEDRINEKLLALTAKQFVENKIADSQAILLMDLGRDKYFRLLARVMVDGLDLGQLLIRERLARPYDGGTKTSWCGV